MNCGNPDCFPRFGKAQYGFCNFNNFPPMNEIILNKYACLSIVNLLGESTVLMLPVRQRRSLDKMKFNVAAESKNFLIFFFGIFF